MVNSAIYENSVARRCMVYSIAYYGIILGNNYGPRDSRDRLNINCKTQVHAKTSMNAMAKHV